MTVFADLPDLTEDALRIDPVERSETIPSSWYVDPRFHAFDREHVFGTSWQYVGPVSRVRNPGEYLADSVAGNPVVVVRDREGDLRGFYNVCRHRGGPLVTDETGTCKVLQCKYHGWTFRLDGSLRGVPKFDRTDLFDRADYGLVPVRVTEWDGLVFVALSDDTPDLARVLHGIPERIAPILLSDLAFHQRDTYDVACNWKVYVDNYLEGYHLPMVHPELCTLLDYRSYVTETFDTYSLQYSGFREGDNLYAAEDGEAFYYFVFPNLMLNILPNRLQVNRVIPVGHDRCRVVFDYFYADTVSDRAKRIIADDLDFSDRVQMEDVEICEHVQVGLQSRAYDRGRFSADAEPGVHHFQSLLKQVYAAALA